MANRLTRFSKPAGSSAEYIALADARADRAEARADKLQEQNKKLVAALRGIVDCARARNVKIDKAAECDAIATTLLRSLGEDA